MFVSPWVLFSPALNGAPSACGHDSPPPARSASSTAALELSGVSHWLPSVNLALGFSSCRGRRVERIEKPP